LLDGNHADVPPRRAAVVPGRDTAISGVGRTAPAAHRTPCPVCFYTRRREMLNAPSPFRRHKLGDFRGWLENREKPRLRWLVRSARRTDDRRLFNSPLQLIRHLDAWRLAGCYDTPPPR